MGRSDLFTALFWIALSIYVALEATRLKLGTWHKPGPGYFPFGAALLLGVASVIVLIQARRNVPSAESARMAPSEGSRYMNIVLATVVMVAYVLLLKHLGFFLCTFFLVAFFQWLVAPRRWLGNLLIALSVSLAFHLVFNVLLNVQIPTGFLGV